MGTLCFFVKCRYLILFQLHKTKDDSKSIFTNHRRMLTYLIDTTTTFQCEQYIVIGETPTVPHKFKHSDILLDL